MIDAATIVILVFAFLYIVYIVFEHFYFLKKRKQIGLVIHVNGIRGKSTVTRLIDAGLRACGYRVFSKTTGTIPMTIDVSNTSKNVKRLGPANIREQLRVLKWATKQNANALVVECMAVNPELQYVCEQQILRADINVITNVRADHLDEMGETLEQIAYSLANTTPQNGTVILGENKFVDIFEKVAIKQGSKVVVAKPYTGDDLMDTFEDNIAAALQVCECLNLDKSTFIEGMKKYIHDPGALSSYKVGHTILINAFSVNDPESTVLVYERLLKTVDANEVTVLLNTRSDRPFRIDQHIEMLSKIQFGKLILTGSNLSYVEKELAKRGITADRIKNPQELLSEKLIFGCGNIIGQGINILNYFKENGEERRV